MQCCGEVAHPEARVLWSCLERGRWQWSPCSYGRSHKKKLRILLEMALPQQVDPAKPCRSTVHTSENDVTSPRLTTCIEGNPLPMPPYCRWVMGTALPCSQLQDWVANRIAFSAAQVRYRTCPLECFSWWGGQLLLSHPYDYRASYPCCQIRKGGSSHPHLCQQDQLYYADQERGTVLGPEYCSWWETGTAPLLSLCPYDVKASSPTLLNHWWVGEGWVLSSASLFFGAWISL